MKRLFMYCIMVFSILFFSGCTPSYSVKPNYDIKTKTISIGTLKLENAEETLNRTPVNSEFVGRVHQKNKKYSFKNDKCKTLFYTEVSASNGVYLTSSFSDNIKKRYGDRMKCEVLEISNLKFYECSGSPSRWFIGYSTPNQNGYSKTEHLDVDNTCYKTIKEHFRLKAIEDKVQLNAYSLYH